MKNKGAMIASVDRFHDKVAVYVGNGSTTYLTQREARKLARALNACARNIKEQPKFSESNFASVEIHKED